MKVDKLEIKRGLQVILALIGGTALCVHWQSWQDAAHLFYDIPAGLVISAYTGQVLLEGLKQKRPLHWWLRVFLLLPMFIIPAGREFSGWRISGHLTALLAAAMIQTLDKRIPVLEKIVYWIPLPIILYIRWFIFDANGHQETFHALVAGFSIFLCYYLIRQIPGHL